ncbi:MAG: winged helix-turn-helix transcriptional regulator [Pseudomonadales bacterium]|nr:winged helix-turn-helix transcriptional regulator [Pseudomonadales bacterium]
MLDKFDQTILAKLQATCEQSVAQIADEIGLSTNACWRRIKRLEEDGIIRKRVALLNEASLGLKMTVFVSIKTNEHNAEWLETFAAGIKALPEVVEFYRMSGDIDYLLKIVVRDIEDYDRVYKKLISVTPLHDVSSSFAMERIKSSTEIPLDHL